MIDYLSYILFRFFGFFIRLIPVSFSLFLARRMGDLFYCLDFRRRAIVYANLRTAFCAELSPGKIKKIARGFYQNLAQDFTEIFLIPRADKKYLDKYITLAGGEYIKQALAFGQGVILLGMHTGSWELSNLTFASADFPYNLVVRQQNMPRLNALLDAYRMQRGCKLIRRQNQARELIMALKRNEVVGMTVDQGGSSGVQVKFFGKFASMATGAIRLALKYNAVILPGYHARIKGPYLKTIIEPPLYLKNTGDLKQDIEDNLRALMPIYEKNIRQYPQDYFWRYKIWKYSREQKILILSDGKAGHLHQAKALAAIVSEYLGAQGVTVHTDSVELKAKNKIYAFKPDIIISCGSSLARTNFMLARQNLAKSIAIMRPSIFSTRKFDLVIMPEHDRPPRRKNVLAIQGALTAIGEDYLKHQGRQLKHQITAREEGIADLCLGLLLGGESKNFHLDNHALATVIAQMKLAADKMGADILATTSRRTSQEGEALIKKEFKGYPPCKFLVIANEQNFSFTVGGILDLSKFVIVSPESISMISEAAASGRYILVFDLAGLKKKHRKFLKSFAERKYIYLVKPQNIYQAIERIWREAPPINTVRNGKIIREALGKIL